MTDVVIDGVRISVSAPAELAEATARPDSPTYDGLLAQLTARFRNETDGPIAVPLDEITNGMIRVYRRAGTDATVVDNEIPPPPRDGKVVSLAPGGERSMTIDIGWPESLMPASLREPVQLTVCLQWREEWLRARNYAPGAVGWNHSFDACADIRIVPD